MNKLHIANVFIAVIAILIYCFNSIKILLAMLTCKLQDKKQIAFLSHAHIWQTFFCIVESIYLVHAVNWALGLCWLSMPNSLNIKLGLEELLLSWVRSDQPPPGLENFPKKFTNFSIVYLSPGQKISESRLSWPINYCRSEVRSSRVKVKNII